jgi:hypothetical protein
MQRLVCYLCPLRIILLCTQVLAALGINVVSLIDAHHGGSGTSRCEMSYLPEGGGDSGTTLQMLV